VKDVAYIVGLAWGQINPQATENYWKKCVCKDMTEMIQC
jgi:hypothetical protein